jgi:Tfp pilus assembly protein PilF
MCKLAYFPWLPAIAFSLAFHATAQRQPYFDEVPFTTVYSSSTIESGDTTPVDQRSELKLQSTHEGVSDQPSGRQQYQALIDSYSKIRRPSAEIWNAMGIAYQMLFDLKDATRCYKNALKIDSLNPNTLNNLATLQDESKEFRTAERTYRKALAIDPRFAIVLKNLGTNLLTQHKYEKGSELYAKALAIDPHIFDKSLGPSISEPSSIGQRGITNYFKARSCARAGLNDCAASFLRKALSEGSTTVKEIEHDRAFENIRDSLEFHLLLAQER